MFHCIFTAKATSRGEAVELGAKFRKSYRKRCDVEAKDYRRHSAKMAKEDRVHAQITDMWRTLKGLTPDKRFGQRR